jgi:hypothetical protein
LCSSVVLHLVSSAGSLEELTKCLPAAAKSAKTDSAKIEPTKSEPVKKVEPAKPEPVRIVKPEVVVTPLKQTSEPPRPTAVKKTSGIIEPATSALQRASAPDAGAPKQAPKAKGKSFCREDLFCCD